MNNPWQIANDGQNQPFVQPLDGHLHIIEEDDPKVEESDSQMEGEYILEDSLIAWQEINSLVRRIGRNLIQGEIKALKRNAEKISQRSADLFRRGAVSHEEKRDPSISATTSPKDSPCSKNTNNKRRRVSGFDEDDSTAEHNQEVVTVEEREALIRKMNRMKRLNALLVSISNSHALLEEEIRGMIDDEPQS